MMKIDKKQNLNSPKHFKQT